MSDDMLMLWLFIVLLWKIILKKKQSKVQKEKHKYFYLIIISTNTIRKQTECCLNAVGQVLWKMWRDFFCCWLIPLKNYFV